MSTSVITGQFDMSRCRTGLLGWNIEYLTLVTHCDYVTNWLSVVLNWSYHPEMMSGSISRNYSEIK